MTPVIHVEGISKRYRIGTAVHDHNRLTEAVSARLRAPFKRNGDDDERRAGASDFWALEDVSFEVSEGDVLGVVGRNGAGKTTLLKILARVTEPTRGRAVLQGQVGALLEVGTGFHPELTGRENIYLNGSILGMSRREIRGKFDEIVAFSEVERFIDTPVKRYSSGMFVRLAFAVAAHLEPEILIIDEVLAVGDVNFQKKCLGKMEDVARTGRTVIFVSHNTGAVAELCTRALLLEAGRKVAEGEVDDVLDAYATLMADRRASLTLEVDPDLPVSIVAVRVTAQDGEEVAGFDLQDAVVIDVEYVVRERLRGLQLAVTVSRNAIPIFRTFDTDGSPGIPDRPPGTYLARLTIPRMFLKAGHYNVDIDSGIPERQFQDLQAIATFDVEERTVNAHSRGYRKDRPGQVIAPVRWESEQIAS